MSYLNRQNTRFSTEHISSGLEAWGALRNSADSGVRWQRCGCRRLSSAMGPGTSLFLSLDLDFDPQLVGNGDSLVPLTGQLSGTLGGYRFVLTLS